MILCLFCVDSRLFVIVVVLLFFVTLDLYCVVVRYVTAPSHRDTVTSQHQHITTRLRHSTITLRHCYVTAPTHHDTVTSQYQHIATPLRLSAITLRHRYVTCGTFQPTATYIHSDTLRSHQQEKGTTFLFIRHIFATVGIHHRVRAVKTRHPADLQPTSLRAVI